MDEKKFERVTRSGHLGAEEIARDEELRRKLHEEFPPARATSPPMPDSMTETLKRAIRDSRRSLPEIAAEAGVSRDMLDQFLAGQRDIPMTVADRLADVLGLKLTVG